MAIIVTMIVTMILMIVIMILICIKAMEMSILICSMQNKLGLSQIKKIITVGDKIPGVVAF